MRMEPEAATDAGCGGGWNNMMGGGGAVSGRLAGTGISYCANRWRGACISIGAAGAAAAGTTSTHAASSALTSARGDSFPKGGGAALARVRQ